MRETLTREKLLELLEFDKTLRRFRWKGRPGNNQFNATFSGKLAGWVTARNSTERCRYRRIMVSGRPYMEHCLVWLVYYGHFPREPLDHIDGDGLNNTPENLRLAPGSINNKNSAKRLDNTSGHANVYWNTMEKRWKVAVRDNGTLHHGGTFKYEELPLAVAKASELRARLGFSPTHGLTRAERKGE